MLVDGSSREFPKMARRLPSPLKRKRPAFSLLEVILALAILAGSVAVLGEVMRIAGRHAANAQAETQAHILAQSVMNEMVVGLTEQAQQTRQRLETDDAAAWLVSVALGTTDVAGLTVIEVLVEQDLEPQFSPFQYRLIRWVPASPETSDPDTDAAEENDQDSGPESNDA